jgi:hypothetical protein
MPHLCVTCGTQFPPANNPPPHCPICEDERQFVGLQGQQWITLEQLRRTHRNRLFQEGEGIWGISTRLRNRPTGAACTNEKRKHFWDCVSLTNTCPDSIASLFGVKLTSPQAIRQGNFFVPQLFRITVRVKQDSFHKNSLCRLRCEPATKGSLYFDPWLQPQQIPAF